MNLLLSLTEKCNLRCNYCYYKSSQVNRELEMSDEILEKSIKLALERTIKLKHEFFNITFFGGEPLLRVDAICKGVEFAKMMVESERAKLPKNFEMHFAVNTNGTLFSNDLLDFFQKEKFQIYLSLDGPEKKHDISRVKINGKGCFKDIAPYIPRLVDMDATVLSVVTRKHVQGLADSVKWVFEQGFRGMSTALDYDGKWTGEDLDALALEYQKMAMFWFDFRNAGKDFYLGTIQDKITYDVLNTRQKEQSCSISKGGFGVAANGNVFPCSRFVTSAPDAKYVLGNVLENGLEMFSGPVAKDLCHFLENDKPECKNCAIKYRCSAHECGCTSFYTTGSIYGVSPEVCTHERILTAICDEVLEKRRSQGYFF